MEKLRERERDRDSNGTGTGNGNGMAVNGRRKKRRLLVRRKRSLDPHLIIDYKLPDVLKRFITDRGKIIPRRISGATQMQQRKITLAIKRARFLGLIPSSVSHRTERGFAGEMQHAAQSFATAGVYRGRPTTGPGAAPFAPRSNTNDAPRDRAPGAPRESGE